MCGIVGYIGKPNRQLVEKLVWESTVRGLHNLGQHIEGNCGIYHARYCTSGGDHQPVYHGQRCLVFNGVIDMGTKEEMEQRHQVKMNTDNDAELALLVPSHFDFERSLIRFLDNPKITFAGFVIDKNNKRFTAIRNDSRPLWMYRSFDGDGTTYFASTLDIFKRAGINTLYCEKLVPLRAYSWPISAL